jgi:nucleoside-diphosphate-sugar epimerase
VFDGLDHYDLTENAPYPRQFASVYSWTKKVGEDRVNAAAKDGLCALILRPKAVFGPGDRALLPRLINAARAGRLPQIGNGQNRVDLTYVDNVVHALLLALQAPAARVHGRTYTITNGEHPLLWDVICNVLRSLGICKRLRSVPLPIALTGAALLEASATLTGREPRLTRYTALILARTQTYDISAAERDLGYVPPVPLAEGIARTIAALRTPTTQAMPEATVVGV